MMITWFTLFCSVGVGVGVGVGDGGGVGVGVGEGAGVGVGFALPEPLGLLTAAPTPPQPASTIIETKVTRTATAREILLRCVIPGSANPLVRFSHFGHGGPGTFPLIPATHLKLAPAQARSGQLCPDILASYSAIQRFQWRCTTSNLREGAAGVYRTLGS